MEGILKITLVLWEVHGIVVQTVLQGYRIQSILFLRNKLKLMGNILYLWENNIVVKFSYKSQIPRIKKLAMIIFMKFRYLHQFMQRSIKGELIS